MSGIVAQPPARQAEVGADNSGVEQGGRRFQDIGIDLLGSGAISTAIQVRYMGPDTAYAESAGRFSPYFVPQSDGTTNAKGA